MCPQSPGISWLSLALATQRLVYREAWFLTFFVYDYTQLNQFLIKMDIYIVRIL